MHSRVCDEGAVVATGGGCSTVVGVALVDKEAEAVSRAKRERDPARAAHTQIARGCLRREVLAKNQLMRLDQHVQRGNTLDAVGKAVALGQIAGNLHSLDPVQISASRLRANGHIGLGDALAGLHGDGIGRGNDRGGVFCAFFCVAAAEGQHRAVLHGDGCRAAIARLAHGQIDLITLIGCRDCNGHIGRFGQGQGVFQSVLVKGRRQRAAAERQCRQCCVALRAPVAADVCTIAGFGV